MKYSNDTIRNRTRDLLACSAVPQSTTPPRSLSSRTTLAHQEYICMCLLHVISEALSVLLRSLNKSIVLRVSGRIQVPSSPLMTAILLPKYDTSASCARCLEKRKYNINCQTNPVRIVTGIFSEFVGRIQQNFWKQ